MKLNLLETTNNSDFWLFDAEVPKEISKLLELLDNAQLAVGDVDSFLYDTGLKDQYSVMRAADNIIDLRYIIARDFGMWDYLKQDFDMSDGEIEKLKNERK